MRGVSRGMGHFGQSLFNCPIKRIETAERSRNVSLFWMDFVGKNGQSDQQDGMNTAS